MPISEWVSFLVLIVSIIALISARRASARSIETQESIHASNERARLRLDPITNLRSSQWAQNQKKSLPLLLTNDGHRPATEIMVHFLKNVVDGLDVPDSVTPTEELGIPS